MTNVDALSKQAKDILTSNTYCENGLYYTVPRKDLYPFQWNWDSAFVALGLSTYDEQRAWSELESLCAGQHENGMIPHVIYHTDQNTYCPSPDFWRLKSTQNISISGISQPPVLAIAARLIFENARNQKLASQAIQKLYPHIFAWHRWWYRCRDPQNSGLVSTFHPWETGRDNAFDWQEAMHNVPIDNIEPYQRKDLSHIPEAQRPTWRDYDVFMMLAQNARNHAYDDSLLYETSPFHVQDTTINFILMKANKDLLWLAQIIQNLTSNASIESDIKDIDSWIKRTEPALKKLWHNDHKAYCSIDVAHNGKHVSAVSSSSFLAPLAGCSDHNDTLIDTLDKWHAKYLLIPSFNPFDQRFDSQKYWRGPIWAIINYLVYLGLKSQGFEEQARKIAIDTIILIKQSQMAEYFHPISGDSLGGTDFSWT